MCRIGFSWLALTGLVASPAFAETVLTAGHWTINPAAAQNVDVNTDLPIAVTATGSDQIAGFNLYMTSGPDGITPFSAPRFESPDLIGPGTIFHTNNTGQVDIEPTLHLFASTSTQFGTFEASGVLAFLSFDATGVEPGVYQLLLRNLQVFSQPTQLLFVSDVTYIDGSITVVPEPSSIALAALAVACLGGVTIILVAAPCRSGTPCLTMELRADPTPKPVRHSGA